MDLTAKRTTAIGIYVGANLCTDLGTPGLGDEAPRPSCPYYAESVGTSAARANDAVRSGGESGYVCPVRPNRRSDSPAR